MRNLGGRRALDGVSLAPEEGEIGCLLGPSGCGKTTALRCIAGLETLAVRVFEMTAEGEWERAALPSVLIVAAGVLPVLLLARRVNHVA